MRSFAEWLRTSGRASDPWLVLGKGPSFGNLARFEPHGYQTIALNHVVRETRVTVAHAIDIEVIEHCAPCIEANAEFVVLPWIPHTRQTRGLLGKETYFGPGERTLADYCAAIPVLHRLASAGRLLWYNLGTAPSPHGLEPVVHTKSFSASAVVNLLAASGVKVIRTLGVDGGSSYSAAFTDLAGSTLLQTYHQSFDVQFREIARAILPHSLDIAPLDVEQPIVVYVGTEPEQTLAVRVLEYSIRKNTSMNVAVRALFEEVDRHSIDIPSPHDERNAARTPFSFQRFAIPALRAYQGRAIYLDSDMQVFGDLRELWLWPFDDAQILAVREPAGSSRPPQFSVMVLDCSALDWVPSKLISELDVGRWTYGQLVHEMAAAERIKPALPSRWNELERHHDGVTALTHYTDMDSQPWLSTTNLLGHLWCRDLFEAIDAGFIDVRDVRDHIERGWVRPSLLDQLERRIIDPLLLPAGIRRRDQTHFVPPHRAARRLKGITAIGRRPNRMQAYARYWYAMTRQLLESSGAERLVRRVRRRIARL